MKRRWIPISPEDRNKFVEEKFIKCECGYHNKKDMINVYGSCHLCGKILDKKAYFNWQIKSRMRNKKEKIM